jgi:hypothetical protein
MLLDTGINDVKKQRNAEYAKHINDPVLSSLKMEGIRLLFLLIHTTAVSTQPRQAPVTIWLYKPQAANTVWSS